MKQLRDEKTFPINTALYILIEQSTIQIIGVGDGWFRGYNLFPVD